MKTKLFVSFTAFVAASVLMCSCSNEESADSNNNSNSNGQLTAFTGGIVTEAPMERMQLSTPEISTEVPGFLTRTSMNRNALRGQGAFLWEPNDAIYVEDAGGNLHKSQNTVTDAAARATFLLDGSYTAKSQYDVYYCGTNTSAGDKKVVIANNQTQVAFNNTKHFGAVGDCGVAKAEKNTDPGKSGFKFDLQHKASYLCFLPYMASKVQRANFKIQSIEITSDNSIAGTYNLSQSGLSNTGTNESKTITLHVGRDGLLLADQAAETTSIKNSLYVVIAPGTHTLKVKYTVLDTKNKVMTITKSYKSHNFGANKICDIPVNLGYVYLYSGYNYYMWDAKENYWSGHEWDSVDNPWQPIDGEDHSGYPESKSKDDARWYHEGVAFDKFQNPLFKELPNAQELAWYVSNGDPHWDNTTKWTAFGKECTGGIWLKKLSVIAEEVGKPLPKLRQDYPDGLVDFGGNSYGKGVTIISGKPANIKDYFFLPALGYWYGKGTFLGLGSYGLYWSSTPDSGDEMRAYGMFFSCEELEFSSENSRDAGGVAQPFE